MSDSQVDETVVAAAAADFEQYRKGFEEKFGYGIGATSSLTPDGRVQTIMQLVKIPAKPSAELSEEDMRMAEVPDPIAPTTPDNGNDETTQTSPSDSPELPTGEAAQ